jgi:hypothetical protein
VCLFDKCVVPGKVCHSKNDCKAGQYCETALGAGAKPDGGFDAGPADAPADGPACTQPLTRSELQRHLGLRDDEHFRKAYLLPALAAGFIERTVPDKPQSRLQRYRLTVKGHTWLKSQVATSAKNPA